MIRYPYKGSLYPCTKTASSEQQITFFHDMLRMRLIEEEIERRYKEDEMKTPIHLVIGQEAPPVGFCAALRKTDWILSGHRTHGVYLAKGGNFRAMMAELYCRTSGCAASRGGSMHLFDKSAGMISSSAICGGAIPIATGAALSVQMRNDDRIVSVFLGDGSSEEGVIWESLNFAALKKLPIVYVCENNFYSVCSPLSKRQPPQVEIFKKAQSFGLNAFQADGTDVLEVYEASKEAVRRVRAGEGPQFLEIVAYRWRAHGGFGDDSIIGYRDLDEVEEWKKRDPIEVLYSKLANEGILTQAKRDKITGDINQEIKDAFEFAIGSPMPEEKDLYTHVYAPGDHHDLG